MEEGRVEGKNREDGGWRVKGGGGREGGKERKNW